MALLDLYISNLTATPGGQPAGAPASNTPPPENGEKKLVRKYATTVLPGGKKTLIDVSKEVAKNLNLDPNMLASSALVEGVNLMFNPKNKMMGSGLDWASDAYYTAGERGQLDINKYPVDAFYYAGLDNFGNMVEGLKKKGYLSKDMDFAVYPAWNESVERSINKYVKDKNLIKTAYEGKGEERFKAMDQINEILAKYGIKPNQTVAFKNPEDMIAAKGAWLRDMSDQVDAYAAKKKVKLTPEEKNYLIMSGYNGGPGTMQGLINDMAAGVKNITKVGGKNRAAHTHVKKRMDYMGYMTDMYSSPFPQQGSLQQTVGGAPMNNQ